MKKEEGKKMSKIYNFYQIALVMSAFIYLFSCDPKDHKSPVDFSPLYRDAIKAVDPLEYFKDGLGAKDFVEH